MRFFHTDFGSKVYDFGPGKLERYRVVGNAIVAAFPEICHTLSRDAGDDCSVVRFTTRMNMDMFKSSDVISYKYAVYSQRIEETRNPCEYLYGAPHGDQYTNRMLRVPIKNCSPGGKYIYILMR